MSKKYISIFAVIVLLGIGGIYGLNKNYNSGPSGGKNLPSPQYETANWKTYAVEPGPTKKFEVKYPPDWDVSELRFSCKDENAQVIALVSPARDDLPGFKNISAAYLAQFCVSNSQTILAYQGFIKAPLSAQPKESDKISLGDLDLKNTAEYQIAQKIIASVSIQAQSNSPQGQNEMANLKTYTNGKFSIDYPSNLKPDSPTQFSSCEGKITGGVDSPRRCEKESHLWIQPKSSFTESQFRNFSFKNKNGVVYSAWKKETGQTYDQMIEIIVKLITGGYVELIMYGDFIKDLNTLSLTEVGEEILSSIREN